MIADKRGRKIFPLLPKTGISNYTVGFDDQDKSMADRSQSPEAVKEHIQGGDQESFRIGVGIVGKGVGHAAVVIEASPMPTPTSSLVDPNYQRFVDEYHVAEPEHEVEKPEKGRLCLAHIRYPQNEEIENVKKTDGVNAECLVLAWDEWKGNLVCHRYTRLCRLDTTMRLLKHIALKSCPEHHRYMTSDCATVARNFLTDLLAGLSLDEIPIKEEDKERLEKQWMEQIHILEGSAGNSEVGTRNGLGQSEKLSGH
jgi:hypothetical protein